MKKITLSDAARQYGKSKQAMSKQLNRHGVAPNKDGMYDCAKVAIAVMAGAASDKNATNAALSSGKIKAGSLIEQKLREQVRKLTADADTAEHHLARLRNEVIPLTEFEARRKEIGDAFFQAVDTWIKTTAAEVGDVAFKRKLEDARRKAFAAIQAAMGVGE